MTLEEVIVWAEPLVEEYGLYVVSAGIMIENAGIPFPGETIMIIGSILAAQGILTIKGVYFASLIGAILGDNFGYAVGRFGGRRLILRIMELFGLKPSYLGVAERQFERWGYLAVFFGRFPALLRVLAGPLAGVMHMPFWRFFLLNASGAALWAALIVGLAFELGENLPLLEKTLRNLGRGAFVLVALLVVFLIVYHRWVKKREAPLLEAQAEGQEPPATDTSPAPPLPPGP